MGVRVFEQILNGCTGLRPVQKLVLLALAYHANADGYAVPTLARVARVALAAGCSKPTAGAALRALIAGGWLILESPATNAKSALYRINVDRLVPGRVRKAARA